MGCAILGYYILTCQSHADAFFMIEAEPALDNVDVATDVTGTTASMFTRYTVARSSTTAFTSKSGQSSASKKRMKRQMMGRKGTVGEWEYLVSSLGRLAARIDEKTGEYSDVAFIGTHD